MRKELQGEALPTRPKELHDFSTNLPVDVQPNATYSPLERVPGKRVAIRKASGSEARDSNGESSICSNAPEQSRGRQNNTRVQFACRTGADQQRRIAGERTPTVKTQALPRSDADETGGVTAGETAPFSLNTDTGRSVGRGNERHAQPLLTQTLAACLNGEDAEDLGES